MVYENFKNKIKLFGLKQIIEGTSLYHYTNINAIKNILSSQSLYFKEINDFKDENEFKFTLEIFKEVLKENEISLNCDYIKDLKENFLPYYKKLLLPDTAAQVIRRYYVFCSCIENNSAHMSKNYGECCIEFKNLSGMFDLFQDRQMFHAKVSYDENSLKNNLKNCLYYYNNYYLNNFPSLYYRLKLMQDLKILAIFNKKISYQKEQEYRFVIVDEKVNDGSHPFPDEKLNNKNELKYKDFLIDNKHCAEGYFYDGNISSIRIPKGIDIYDLLTTWQKNNVRIIED